MRIYVLVHRIYEPDGAGTNYPVVEHRFAGKTKREAEGYFRAHMKTDAFIKACEAHGNYKGMECPSTKHWEYIEV